LVYEGEIYATINSLLGTAGLMSKLGFSDIKIAGETALDNSYKIGIIKGEPLLASILSKAVKSISESEKNKTLANWMSVKFEKSTDYSLIFKVTAFLLFVIALFAYRQYSISQLNRELKAEMQKQYQKIIEQERMISQQNKRISMGEMIENIAHQWRQPLAQVNASVMLIDDYMYENNCISKEIEKELGDIERCTKYMSQTIDDFRSFLDEGSSEEEFYPSRAVEQTLAIVEKSLKHLGIRVVQKLDEDLMIRGKHSEFTQVLMVLLSNAKEAIVANQIAEGKINISIEKRGEKALIEVSDNGGGVDASIIDKIFDPYFTTKHKSKGRGLGLYISSRIIEGRMNGEIGVANKEACASFFMEFELCNREEKDG